MKKFVPLFLATLFLVPAYAAEPWVCTQEGTCFEYSVRIGKELTGTLVRTVKSAVGNEVLIEAREGGKTTFEHWRIYPDSTVLRMEMPDGARQVAAQAGGVVETVRARNFALPAALRPGDTFPGFEFEMCGSDEKRTQSVRFRMTAACEVVAVEKIKLPTGRAEAVRIDLHTETTIVKEAEEPMMVPITVTQWFVAGVGLVRQEIPVPMLDAKVVEELIRIVKP